jgi:hypothetical protein
MEMYRQMSTKLAPEHVTIDGSGRLSSPGGCASRMAWHTTSSEPLVLFVSAGRQVRRVASCHARSLKHSGREWQCFACNHRVAH